MNEMIEFAFIEFKLKELDGKFYRKTKRNDRRNADYRIKHKVKPRLHTKININRNFGLFL